MIRDLIKVLFLEWLCTGLKIAVRISDCNLKSCHLAVVVWQGGNFGARKFRQHASQLGE